MRAPSARWMLGASVLATLAPFLALHSGYTAGALALLALGLRRVPRTARHWCARRRVCSGGAAAWAAAIVIMGLAWAMHIVDGGEVIWRTLGVGRSAKCFLILPIVLALISAPLRADTLRWACWLGAAGAGLLALHEVLVLGQERADGHTNAIQFGNLALLLGAWSAAWALHARHAGQSVLVCAAGWLAAALGLGASIASGSRGGWQALPLLALMLALLAAALRALTVRRAAPLLAAAAAASLLLLALPPVHERLALVQREWQQAGSAPLAAGTSVGLRRSFWRFAWEQGGAQPLAGIGQRGYERALAAAAKDGRLPAVAVEFNHAHNEWLDMWAKRGLLGCVALALFYAVPAVLLWSAWRRAWRQRTGYGSAANVAAAARATAALCGLLAVAGYLVFGATQVMFAHNNGNMFYLLGISVWLAASGALGAGAGVQR